MWPTQQVNSQCWNLAKLMVTLYSEKHLAVERHQPPSGANYLASTFSRLVPDVSHLAALGWRAEIAPTLGFRRIIEAYNT